MISIFFLVFAVTSMAGEFPVDDDINELLEKARFLTTMKETFRDNSCTVSVGSTTVRIPAGALRANGLAIAVSEGYPGNYLAFHNAPKPDRLGLIIDATLGVNGAGAGAAMITADLVSGPGTEQYTQLIIDVGEPWLTPGTDGLWLYRIRRLRVPLPIQGKPVSVEGKTFYGRLARFRCN